MTSTFARVIEAPRKREELHLPILYYPVVDPYMSDGESWIDTLGEKTFCAWLRLHTMVDRRNGLEKYSNLNTVPKSLSALMDTFKMSKSTFYRQVIHPLWNYALIDVVEWEEDTKKGMKSMNIIVYPYPQNRKELENKPLQKVRDYKNDYESNGKLFGDMGAYVRKKIENDEYLEQLATNELAVHMQEKETYPHGSTNETIDDINVSDESVDLPNRFKNETEMVSKMKPINNTNTINSSNPIKHEEENNFNINNDSIYGEPVEISPLAERSKSPKPLNEYSTLLQYLRADLMLKNVPIKDISVILEQLDQTTVPFTLEHINEQLTYMASKIQSKQIIYNFAEYFVNGVIKRAQEGSFAESHINGLAQENYLKSLQSHHHRNN